MGFTTWPTPEQCSFDLRANPFPTTVAGWAGESLSFTDIGTHFGFAFRGGAELECESGRFTLRSSMYFAVPGTCKIRGGSGLVITRVGYRGFFHLGGPLEARGRLHYIDGCTDSLLIASVVRGDPCLNMLHIPPGTNQTMHHHPSIRVGIIVSGEGECLVPENRIPLTPGCTFIIPAGLRHCFRTTNRELLVVAYHPDSDFGPTHECHPMVNRTIITENDHSTLFGQTGEEPKKRTYIP